MKVPKETEQQIAEFQGLQSQIQMVLAQKNQVQMQLEEVSGAEEELKTCKGTIYKSAGTLLIQASKEDAEKDLKEKKEVLEVRSNALARQEEKIKTRLMDLKKLIEAAMSSGGEGA